MTKLITILCLFAYPCLLYSQKINGSVYTELGWGTITPQNTYKYKVKSKVINSEDCLIIDRDKYDFYGIKKLKQPLFIKDAIGKQVDGQITILAIKDNGISQYIKWGNKFSGVGIELPLKTDPNKRMYIYMIYFKKYDTESVISCVVEN